MSPQHHQHEVGKWLGPVVQRHTQGAKGRGQEACTALLHDRVRGYVPHARHAESVHYIAALYPHDPACTAAMQM